MENNQIEVEQKKTVRFSWAKCEDILGVAFVALLSVLPLLVKLFTKLGIVIVNSDNALMHFVYVFVCIAGAITWRTNSHISLASLTDKLSSKPKTVIDCIRECTVPCVLTALFFASLSATFLQFDASQKLWGISYRFIFACFPLAYLSMIVRSVIHSEHKISCIIGLVLGLLISTGPLSGVLYSVFNAENLTALYKISDGWIFISQHATAFLIVLMIVFAILGVPLFVVIGAVSYIAFSQGGGYVESISAAAYNILIDKSIAAIPLFTVAGFILSQGSAGRRLVEVFRSMFGWFRGGTVIATVIVVTFFTTFTGGSGITILALGALLSTALCGSGYKEGDAEALITSSGAIGLLFPPSVAIIMYGTVNFFSVDVYDVFKGAIIPGAILAISMIILGIVKDKQGDRPKFSWQTIGSSLKGGAFELLMPVFIMLFFFTGLLSLMETAAFAVLYAFVIETFVRKDFTLKKAVSVVAESVPITGGVLFILASARGLSDFMIDANIPVMFSEFVEGFIHSKFVFLLLMNVFLILAGCLMDIFSAILIISPLLMPFTEVFGISPVHLAVVFLMNMQLGFLTPPVGMDLFISSYTFKKPLMTVVKNILPFLLVQLIVLLLVTYVPWFSTLLIK